MFDDWYDIDETDHGERKKLAAKRSLRGRGSAAFSLALGISKGSSAWSVSITLPVCLR